MHWQIQFAPFGRNGKAIGRLIAGVSNNGRPLLNVGPKGNQKHPKASSTKMFRPPIAGSTLAQFDFKPLRVASLQFSFEATPSHPVIWRRGLVLVFPPPTRLPLIFLSRKASLLVPTTNDASPETRLAHFNPGWLAVPFESPLRIYLPCWIGFPSFPSKRRQPSLAWPPSWRQLRGPTRR